MRGFKAFVTGLVAGAAMLAAAGAQAYPDRPITMIVPWGAGGAPMPPHASSPA